MESQTKKSKYEIDMCNGTIMDKLISFSLPLMLSGILQLMFKCGRYYCGWKVQRKSVIGGSWINNSIDQYVYQSFYWNFSWSKCSGSTFLCGKARKGDVRDGTYRNYTGINQRDRHGICGSDLFEICVRIDGYTG